MPLHLARHWWSLLLRGIAAVLFALVTFAWPGITLSALVLLFGVYALLDGIFNLVGAWRASQHGERWGALLVEGFIGIAAGVAAFAWPAITLAVLIYLIAAWALVTGILEIAAAIRLRKHVQGEWLLALTGIASILFGFAVAIAPIAGALVIALWIGAYALIFGVLMIALAFRLRGHHIRLSTAQQAI
jgi:uncharacterized membrane protein HdeD (DUF308 family)